MSNEGCNESGGAYLVGGVAIHPGHCSLWLLFVLVIDQLVLLTWVLVVLVGVESGCGGEHTYCCCCCGSSGLQVVIHCHCW